MILILPLSMGLLLIMLGFLVKKHPDIIAGYNTMPKVQKEKFDIRGYSSLMKKAFIAVGLAIMLLGAVSYIIGLPEGILLTTIVPVLALVVFLTLKAERYK